MLCVPSSVNEVQGCCAKDFPKKRTMPCLSAIHHSYGWVAWYRTTLLQIDGGRENGEASKGLPLADGSVIVFQRRARLPLHCMLSVSGAPRHDIRRGVRPILLQAEQVSSLVHLTSF